MTFPKESHLDYYTGNFHIARVDGHGTMYYKNGDKYVGQWKQDLPHGKGILTKVNGEKIEQYYDNGKLVDNINNNNLKNKFHFYLEHAI